MSIKQIYENLDKSQNYERSYSACGWVRTCRTSGSTLGFCNINDGSNVDGLQIVISDKFMLIENITEFFKNVKTGAFVNCIGKILIY